MSLGSESYCCCLEGIVMSLGDRVKLLYGRDSEVMSLGNKSYCCWMEGMVMSL